MPANDSTVEYELSEEEKKRRQAALVTVGGLKQRGEKQPQRAVRAAEVPRLPKTDDCLCLPWGVRLSPRLNGLVLTDALCPCYGSIFS